MNRYFSRREQCPGCGSTGVQEIRRASYGEAPLHDYLVSFYSPQGGVEFEYLTGQDYVLAECGECGLIYQAEIPNGELMHRLYEMWINPVKVRELYERDKPVDALLQAANEIAGAVRHFNLPQHQLRFLDFSMGWGHWCKVAQAFGCEVEGTEFNAACREHAARNGIRVVDGDALVPASYDFINVSQVMEHLPAPRETLAQLVAALKPRGLIKVGVPDGWDIRERLRAWNWAEAKGGRESLNAVAPLEHINCFDHRSLVGLASAVGLELFEPTVLKPPRQRPMAALKDAMRPWYHRLRRGLGREVPPPNKGTELMFRIRNRGGELLWL